MNDLLNNIKHTFRALRHRNYKLYFTGQGISLTGTWMQQMAISWLTYRITNSVFMLGLVGFLGQIPSLFFMPFAGVFADRYSRHRILIITQALEMAQAFVLAALIMSGVVSIWHIIILTVFLGIVIAFDAPARHAFVVEMVSKKEDLSNAIALNSLVFNAARLIGPSIAGILVALMGEGMCFLINGVSYIAVIFALLNMSITPRMIKEKNKPIIQGLKEGISYTMNNPTIKAIMLITALISLVGMSYVVLMPVFAKDVLGGNSGTLGYLMGASGLGALLGALYLASRKSIKGLGRISFFTANIFGIGIIAFSFSRVLWLSMLILVFTGFGMMAQMASNNTVLQTIVHDDKRGRVMSIFMVAFMGVVPFGSLLAGSLAHAFGAPYTLLILGIACILGSFALVRRMDIVKEAHNGVV
ncbi:MAG: MFS transporter [Candidatus Omnitrophota bacterium]